jgi:hypothetical protein
VEFLTRNFFLLILVFLIFGREVFDLSLEILVYAAAAVIPIIAICKLAHWLWHILPKPKPKHVAAYQVGYQTATPPPTPAPPPEPTVGDLFAAAIELHHRNLAIIDASPMADDEKETLRHQERDRLTQAIRGVLDTID